MTAVMHKILMYLSICFGITCFGLSFSPSSEAGVLLQQWFNSPTRIETSASEDGLKESPKYVRKE
jgi:hypothetical protein